MGLFSAITEWNEARQQKRISEAESQGKCPNCKGSGLYYPYGLHEFYYSTLNECYGCNGSGLYSDWAEIQQR